MPTAHRDTRLTYEDFVRFPDDGMRHELIDGVHYVTPCPVTRHQQLVGRLHLAIGTYLEILTDVNIQGAPALVIEILSPGTRTRELGIKRQLFDRGGVREYWAVDPKAEDLTVYRRLPDGGLARVSQLRASETATLSTPLLPGFSLSLAKLFAQLLPNRS